MSVTEIKKSSAPKETGSGMERFNAIKPGTNVAYTTLFILLAVLCVIPVVFVIIISFSSEASIGKVGYSFLPAEWSTDAYDYVWHLRNTRGIPTIILAFLTSVGLTVVGTLIGLTLISTMGYVLSRRSFKLRGIYTTLIFIPMIFNGGLLSTYVVNTQLLGLKNTYWALIFPLADGRGQPASYLCSAGAADFPARHCYHRPVPHLRLLERLVSGQSVY